METAVKERLVGGAILVLLVVLVVPALLTGPRELPPSEPDSQGPSRTVEIDISGAQPTVDAGHERATDPPADPPVVTPAPSGLPEPAAASGSPAAPGAQEVQRAPSETLPAPALQPVNTAPSARPEPAAPGSAWAVQLAALSNEDSARKMVADLKKRGYSAFLLEYRSDNRILYRVRVGPEAQRDGAAALASRLEGEGFKATVVSHP
jgi:cell division septation protein DedD